MEYDDIFDDEEIENFDVDSLYYGDEIPPPELEGCKRIVEGQIYDFNCKNNNDQDLTKGACLLYACSDTNLSEPIWNQRKNILNQYFNTSFGCDKNKIIAEPVMKANGYRLFISHCNKSIVEENPSIPP